MSYTLNEKVEYNRNKKSDFSAGYVFGVNLYRAYPKAKKADKAALKEIISESNINARNGQQWDKGIMCGIRDAANERKARKGK